MIPEVRADKVRLFEKARGAALRLFKSRPRSVLELREILLGKAHLPEVVDRVVADLTARGLLDDSVFARGWMQGRLKRYGYLRVAGELQQKGLPREVIASLWEDMKKDHDEEETARAIAQRRLKVAGDLEPLKQKKRVMDYLARRGFSPEIISKVLYDRS